MRRGLVRSGGLVLLVALLVVLASGCSSYPSPGDAATATPLHAISATTIASGNVIANAVMARSVQGAAAEPVDITNDFPPDQAVFHTVVTIADAPDNTVVRVAWLAVDSQLSEYLLAAKGSRNLDFVFRPEGGRLPAGSYPTEIYVNGKLDRTLHFTVQGATARATPAAPSPLPTRMIASVTLALDTQGVNKDPVNPTALFPPGAVIHAIVAIQNAPANTRFTATWYAVDVGGIVPPNTRIDSTDLTTERTRNLDFALAPTTTWPVGKYRVDISVNGQIDQSADFVVR